MRRVRLNVIRPADRSLAVNIEPPPNWPEAAQSFGFIRRLSFLYALAATGVLATLLLSPPIFRAARTSGTTGIVAGALLLGFTGLLGCWPLARARLERPIPRLCHSRYGYPHPLIPNPAFRSQHAARHPGATGRWCRDRLHLAPATAGHAG
jgi:hypothetical protein